MGDISIINKWDLQHNNWRKCINDSEKGKAVAFVNYQDIINDETQGVEYIILAYGTRTENHTKDNQYIKEKECGIDKIISYFQNANKNIIVKLFLMDADAPIVEESKLLASYIDKLSIQEKVNSINVIGVSKCGVMTFNMPKYFKNTASFDKCNIYTVAAPFNGTKMASPIILYPDIKRIITAKIGDNKLANSIYKKVISTYEGICSNSHMDYDIAVLGGIPSDRMHLYDESLIKNIFSEQNIQSISKISYYKNIVTGIDDNTFKEAFKTMNLLGIALCLSNDYLFDKKSDGMVLTSSQRLVESHIEDLKSHILTSSHHYVATNERNFNEILYIVNDTIDEQRYNAKSRIRKQNK